MSQSLYSLTVPNGNPQKVPPPRNPFLSETRVESERLRWVNQEVYEGNHFRGKEVHLEIRDARETWWESFLGEGLLAVDDIRDFLAHGNKLWLATRAGVVAFEPAIGFHLDRIQFFPELGDSRKLLLRTADDGRAELLCLSRQGAREFPYRFLPRPENGRNWVKLDDLRLFRNRFFLDGPWHWFQELDGFSVFFRGLSQSPRLLLEGRFADEIAMAAAAWGDRLYAATPLGLARFRFNDEGTRLELEAILKQVKGLALPDLKAGVASLFADAKGLWFVCPSGVYRIQAILDSEEFTVENSWPFPSLPGAPTMMSLVSEPPNLVLRVTGDEKTPFYREFVLGDGGIEGLRERRQGPYVCAFDPEKLAMRVRRSDSSSHDPGSRVVEGQNEFSELDLAEYGVPICTLCGTDRIWLVYPDRVMQTFPEILARRPAGPKARR